MRQATRQPMRQAPQRGQAVVESLLGLAVLAILLMLLAMVDRLQDLALRAAHASRFMAMSLVQGRDVSAIDVSLRRRFFDPAQHRWVTRHGLSMTQGGRRVGLSSSSLPPTSAMQVGQSRIGPLRQELLAADSGIVVARVRIAPQLGPVDRQSAEASPSGLRLQAWDRMVLTLDRHTAMVANAGHAANDAAVADRLDAGEQAWRAAADRSRQAGRAVAQAMSRVDAPWGRPAPDFDWLRPWQDVVPADRLARTGGGQ